jgi:hypothetical protein
LQDIVVTQADITSDAELHYKHSDEAAALAAARDAKE